MKKITVRLRWSPQEIVDVGQVAEVDRRIYFEYDATTVRLDFVVRLIWVRCYAAGVLFC